MKPSPKDIEIKCPCCGTEILVDVATRKVIRHSGEKKPEETLDDMLDKEKSREKDPDKKLDAVFGEMKKRKTELEDLFNEAKKKAEENPTDPKPDPFRWD